MVIVERHPQPIPCAVCGCNATHTRVFHATKAAPGNPALDRASARREPKREPTVRLCGHPIAFA
jgi:hypothetical protein